MHTYFLDNCLSLHQPLQPTLFMYNEHGSYMYRITHCESTLSALSKLKTMSTHLNAFGKWKSKQSFIHLTKMTVLKMIDWARLSFKKETLFDYGPGVFSDWQCFFVVVFFFCFFFCFCFFSSHLTSLEKRVKENCASEPYVSWSNSPTGIKCPVLTSASYPQSRETDGHLIPH